MIVGWSFSARSKISFNTAALFERSAVAILLSTFAACSQIDSQPPYLPEPSNDTSRANDSSVPPAIADQDTQKTEESLPEVPLSEDALGADPADCTYEWVTGIAEVMTWENDRAILVFYPGEIRLSVERNSITPYLTEQQRELKSRLQKPLNKHCGKPAISFSPDLVP